MTDEELETYLNQWVKATFKPNETYPAEGYLFRDGWCGDYSYSLNRPVKLKDCVGVGKTCLGKAEEITKIEVVPINFNYPDFMGYPDEEPEYKKPPLGLKPKYVWIDQRIDEIKAAVNRCFEAGYPVKTEWIEEYNELVRGKSSEQRNGSDI